MSTYVPIPRELATQIEDFVTTQHERAERNVSSYVLDEDGVYLLYDLVTEVYRAGYEHGVNVQYERSRGVNTRKFNRDQVKAKQLAAAQEAGRLASQEEPF